MRRSVFVCLIAIVTLGLGVTAQAWTQGTVASTPTSQAVQPPAEILPDPSHVVVDMGPRMTGLYHRADCPWLRGLSTTKTFVIEDARKRYFRPHCLCVHGEEKAPPCPHVQAAAPVQTAPTSTLSAAPPLEKPVPARAVPEAPKLDPAKLQPHSVTRCQATTQKGRQCLRNAQPGRSFCWQH